MHHLTNLITMHAHAFESYNNNKLVNFYIATSVIGTIR